MNRIPIQILDWRVAVFDILSGFKPIQASYNVKTQKNWLRAAWAIRLNRGFTGFQLNPFHLVVVDDTGPYWKYDYLIEYWARVEQTGEPSEALKSLQKWQKKNKVPKGVIPRYKDGRPEKGDDWYMVCDAGKEYLLNEHRQTTLLSYQGFEADDLAAAIVRCSLERRANDTGLLELDLPHIYLHTIDTDWLGLVGEHVTWVDMANYGSFSGVSRVRDVQETITYASRARALKATIEEPREIWDIKVQKGDASDNLIPHSPLEVIDLLKPPEDWDILKLNHRPLIEQTLDCKINSVNSGHLKGCIEWMRRNGFNIPMFGFNLHPIDFSADSSQAA